jgi:hypothetical protein
MYTKIIKNIMSSLWISLQTINIITINLVSIKYDWLLNASKSSNIIYQSYKAM